MNRYWHTLRLCMIRSSVKRTAYLRKHGIFHSIGNQVLIMPRKIPLYSKLISFGNNVSVGSGVVFLTHDGTHTILNRMKDGHRYTEKIGCIEIGNNVFIGAGSKILYDVRVGNNVIIAAGSVVTKDIPSNSVVGGVPARVISSFDEYAVKRREFTIEHPADNRTQEISPACEKEMWERFSQKHSQA